MNQSIKTPSLWTKDFTIITVGSAISMLGNAISGFSMSLLVLDYTKSTFLYAIYIAVYTLPQIIMPIISGAFLDRFSRKKTIYTLDFISALLYAIASCLLYERWFSFPVLALFCFLIGTINSIYTVAYQSFYPLLITEGNYSKAYSIASLLETLSAIMIPIATYAYNIVGIAPLLAFNALSFLTAAIMETRITTKEKYIDLQAEKAKKKTLNHLLFDDIKEGIVYLAKEKGLLAITSYFTIVYFALGASNVITLPYFKGNYPNGEYVYMLVWGMAVLGRSLGSIIHYRFKYPAKIKYHIALFVYIATTLQEAFYLYTNVPCMMVLCLLAGILGVTSYTIRISSTQNYVPDEKKGRYNGAFNMLITTGSLAGQMLAGSLTLVFPMRYVLTGFLLFNTLSAVVIIGGNRKEVSKIYNTQQ